MRRGCSHLFYLRPVSYIILTATLVTTLVAMVTSDWYHVQAHQYKCDVHTKSLFVGLWKECFDMPDFGECTFMPAKKTRHSEVEHRHFNPDLITENVERGRRHITNLTEVLDDDDCIEVVDSEGSHFHPSTKKIRLHRGDVAVKGGMLATVRILYAMGILMLLGALCYPPFFKEMSADIIKIEVMAVFAAVGGACLSAGMLYTTLGVLNMDDHPQFGFSFMLGWVAVGFSMLSTILVYAAAKENVYIEKT